MKKILVILLCMALVLGCVACSAPTDMATGETPSQETTDAAAEQPTGQPTGETPEQPAETAVATDDYDPSTKTIMCVLPIKGHPVFQNVRAGFLNKAKEMGYNVQVAGIDGVDEAQYIAACETAIANNVDGIMIWPLGPYLYPTTEKLHNAGIKVVAPHVPTPEGKDHGFDANFSADPVAYGKEAALAIGNALNGKTGTVAISQTAFNILENDAAKSFKETLESNFPNLKALDPIEEGSELAAATQKNAALIQANPDILGAYSTTGGGCQSWAAAKRETGRSDLIVIGMDYTEANIDLVKNGEVYGFIAQPVYEEAEYSVEILDKLLRGEEVPYFTPLDAPVVTVGDLDYYEKLMQEIKNWFS
jgi:ribose transport system substrate-binding protein